MTPYLSINNKRNNLLAEQYRQLAELEENVFGGRFGLYKYYDMAPVIEHVLKIPNF